MGCDDLSLGFELSNAYIFPFQEPNLGSSRLAILIDSLVAGAEVYNDTTINEMDVVLN